MNKSKFKHLIILTLAILVISCNEEEPLPEIEEPITILGKWFFAETEHELISKDDNIEIYFPDPDYSDLEWTFLLNDTLLTVNQDTSFTSWYNYDTSSMRLEFDSGFYDVLKHTEDSLNLRFYSDITVAEFYTYFKLIR